MTQQNGCLEAARGYHVHEGLLGPVFDSMPENVSSAMKWEPILTDRSTLVFFHDFAPHRSGINKSPHQRRLLLAAYAKATEYPFMTRSEYYASKLQNFPPDIYQKDG